MEENLIILPSDKKGWPCPVCSENDRYPLCITSCGHSLCEICIPKLKEKKCPFCRSEFETAKPNYALGKLCGLEYKEPAYPTYKLPKRFLQLVVRILRMKSQTLQTFTKREERQLKIL